jgi:hypothetical protein
MVKSWDCFDTLIGRLKITPESIFDEVGKILGIDNFAVLRLNAERQSDKTFSGIYSLLPGIDKNIEFDTEIRNLFPIIENMSKVQDGDIIVSDMYYSPEEVLFLLRACGLTKDVKVYVTYGGKANGWVWNTIPESSKIELHTGDNHNSDYVVALQNNIPANHYTGAEMTDAEKLVYETDKDLAGWMRYIRLSCPYKDETQKYLWVDQANLNAPVLALACLELSDSKLAFAYRGAENWHTIYKGFIGGDSIELHSTRDLYFEPTEGFSKYVIENTRDRLVVDLNCGKSSSNHFFHNQNLNYDLFCITGPASEYKEIELPFERHNLSLIGALIDVVDSKFIRKECENIPEYIIPQKEAIKFAAESISKFKINKNKLLMWQLIKKMRDSDTEKLLFNYWAVGNNPVEKT